MTARKPNPTPKGHARWPLATRQAAVAAVRARFDTIIMLQKDALTNDAP